MNNNTFSKITLVTLMLCINICEGADSCKMAHEDHYPPCHQGYRHQKYELHFFCPLPRKSASVVVLCVICVLCGAHL